MWCGIRDLQHGRRGLILFKAVINTDESKNPCCDCLSAGMKVISRNQARTWFKNSFCIDSSLAIAEQFAEFPN